MSDDEETRADPSSKYITRQLPKWKEDHPEASIFVFLHSHPNYNFNCD